MVDLRWSLWVSEELRGGFRAGLVCCTAQESIGACVKAQEQGWCPCSSLEYIPALLEEASLLHLDGLTVC